MLANYYPKALRTSLARWLLLYLLVFGAIISAGAGALNGIHRSQDFQWSGERILLEHSDPWAEYLRGDPQHRFIDTQIPNYLPILNVLIVPLGLLSLVKAKCLWVICNLSFAICCGILAARFYGFRGRRMLGVICIFLMSTPTRIAIGNGQQSLLVLFVWCAALLDPKLSKTRAALSGISYFKFTFGPPVFLYVWFLGGMSAALLTFVPAILSLGLVWLWITKGYNAAELVRLVWEPLRAAEHGYSASGSDPNLMNVIELLLKDHLTAGILNGFELLVAIVPCVIISYYAFRKHRRSTTQWQMALLAIMNFTLFKHHSYDGVVLLLPFTYALRYWREAKAQLALFLFSYFFFFQRVLESLRLYPKPIVFVEFVMLLAIFYITYSLRSIEEGPGKHIDPNPTLLPRAAR